MRTATLMQIIGFWCPEYDERGQNFDCRQIFKDYMTAETRPPSGTIATHRVADYLREERAPNGRKESRLFPSFFRHISSSVARGTRGARPCLTVSMSGGPYGGSSSLAAFIRVGAVTVGLTYGVVMNTFTGLFSPSKK